MSMPDWEIHYKTIDFYLYRIYNANDNVLIKGTSSTLFKWIFFEITFKFNINQCFEKEPIYTLQI